MATQVVYVTRLSHADQEIDFLSVVETVPELRRNFIVSKGGASSITSVLRDQLIELGASRIFKQHITCDAVLHPGIDTDEVDALILGFVKKLKGVRNLIITDPYIYAVDVDGKGIELFEKMLQELSDSLESITFFPNSKKKYRQAIQEAAKKVVPRINLVDVNFGEFHDRFWLDADRKIGLVMGCSLNGYAKKIALIDYLSLGDCDSLVKIALNAKQKMIGQVA